MAQADRRLWLGVTVKYGTGDRFKRQSASKTESQKKKRDSFVKDYRTTEILDVLLIIIKN